MSRSGNALLLEDGEEIPILDEAVNGSVDHWTSDGITGVVSGWAANVDGSAPADAIVIVRNGEVATVSAPNLDRPDVAEYFEDDQLAASGFELQFPADDEMEVRVFGVKGDHASELPYADGFPW